jgi:hypothetical protein
MTLMSINFYFIAGHQRKVEKFTKSRKVVEPRRRHDGCRLDVGIFPKSWKNKTSGSEKIRGNKNGGRFEN